jgi:2-polyprenyl-6-methoxyphenol hydroxylase-like FAD-dependent oxidoreductase
MDTDVIVVGSGPTGLTLAGELALAGVRVTVLEVLEQRTGLSKALNLQPRTAELLHLRGLLASAEQRAITTVTEGHFGGIPLTYDGWDTPFPYQVGIPQARVEQVLEERLAELGVKVSYGHELVDFTQEADGVVAVVRKSGGEITLRASYLVGCDGGRGAVRRKLGVGFPGLDGTGYGVVADVILENRPASIQERTTTFRGVFEEAGQTRDFSGMFPLGEPGLFRFVYGNRGHRPENLRAPVTAEEVVARIRKRYGDAIEVPEVRWVSRFSDASRQVDQYRVGRVLLAGDAAHIHFPAGGQGLNLGVQDAMNLGWKLAAEVRGWAPEGLLDSYHTERHMVGAGVVDNVLAQSALNPGGPESAALRRIFARLTEYPDVNRHLAGMVSGLDIRYECDGEPHPLLGARLPGAGRAGLLHAGRGVLLTKDPKYAEIARRNENVDVVESPELYGIDVDAVLVRPDGYVCWVSPNGLEAALVRWFGGR